jgi:hypothetical protein
VNALPRITFALLMGACQEPFGADRHDLLGFRVAAIGAEPRQSGDYALRIAVIADGRPWSDQEVALAWVSVPDSSAETVASADPADAFSTSPLPTVPAGQAVALIARHGDREWRGALDVPPAGVEPPRFAGVELYDLDLTVADVQAADLDLAARQARADGAASTWVPEGGFGRMRALVEREATVRWMATSPSGTFFELEAGAADWAAGHLLRDGDEIEERAIQPLGPRTVIALALHPDRAGVNTWTAREVFVGPPGVGIWTAGLRFLGTNAEVPGDMVRGTLEADDLAPTGLILRNVSAASPDDDPGTTQLPCSVPVSGPFDPTWLLEQRCTRSQVVGAEVVVKVGSP